MTSSEPINVDDWRYPLDVEDYADCCQAVKQEDVKEEKVDFSPPPDIPILPGKSRSKRPKTPRRHPEDADIQDKVLASMVDAGFTWEYLIRVT